MTLTITSYNSNGLGAGRPEYIERILTETDILLLQEHWLHNTQCNSFQSFIGGKNCGYSSLLKSGMPEGIVSTGRPYGGCGIIWKDSINAVVTPVNTVSDRLCCAIFQFDNVKILIICVYMPCDCPESDTDNMKTFDDTLDTISEQCTTNDVNFIVIGGDLNTDITRSTSPHTDKLLSFVEQESFYMGIRHNCSDITYTYESKQNYARSSLDHFLITQNLTGLITKYSVINEVDNPSDHLPLVITLQLDQLQLSRPPSPANKGTSKRCLWEKAELEHLDNYKRQLDKNLAEIIIPLDALHCNDLFCTRHKHQIDNFAQSIVNACLSSSLITIPVNDDKCRRRKRQNTPGWNDNVRQIRDKAIFWHNIWKSNDCPQTGLLFDIRRQTRCAYHMAIKINHKKREKIKANKMAFNMINSNRNFWDCVRHTRQSDVYKPRVVDDARDDHSICELLANKYRDLYNSVQNNKSEFDVLRARINNGIVCNCRNKQCSPHNITVSVVETNIHKLKKSKYDGYAGHSTDHVIHATKKLNLYMSLLFNCMVHHGCPPDSLLISTIISIPKNTRKSLSDSDNYRGIALSSILGKLLDLVLIDLNRNVLSTCNMQFGFKKAHSTTHCTFVMRETINYYTRRNGQVHTLLLDASKAFDRVNYIKLFDVLLHRGLCPTIIRFLMNMYTNQLVRCAWNNEFSDFFPVGNGVKQGGVLSPLLFTVYIDELFKRLESSGIGCFMGNLYAGAVGYADDTALIAPSVSALGRMFKMCLDFAEEYGITINDAKSIYMVFGNNTRNVPTFRYQDRTIHRSTQAKHLGHIIDSNKINSSLVDQIIHSFNISFNSLNAMFLYAYPSVKYRLFKTFCLNFYGCTLVDFSDRSSENLFVAWRKAIRKLFGLHYRTHCRLLPYICQDLPIEYQLHNRICKFFSSCLQNANELISFCGQIALIGSGSPISNSINHIACKYSFNKDVFRMATPMPTLTYDPNLLLHANNINDFLNMRSNSDSSTVYNQITDILDYLCTQCRY